MFGENCKRDGVEGGGSSLQQCCILNQNRRGLYSNEVGEKVESFYVEREHFRDSSPDR